MAGTHHKNDPQFTAALIVLAIVAGVMLFLFGCGRRPEVTVVGAGDAAPTEGAVRVAPMDRDGRRWGDGAMGDAMAALASHPTDG